MTVKSAADLYFILASNNLGAYITAVHMSLKGHGLIDVTTMGSVGHKWASDELLDDSFTVDFLFDTTLASMWTTLEALRIATTYHMVEIGPQGAISGQVKISGNVWMEELPMEVVVGDLIRITGVSFKFHDGATIGTY